MAKLRFERLIDAMEGGEVIPFLGAGVSAGAKAPKDGNLGEELHGSSMIVKLASKVMEDAAADESYWKLVRGLMEKEAESSLEQPRAPVPSLKDLEPTKDDEDQKATKDDEDQKATKDAKDLSKHLDHLKKLGGSPLSRLSELVAMRHGYAELCETLHIDRFTELQPAPAHRAIAALLLERAFREVITTNYDCCLERAFLELQGREGDVTTCDDCGQVRKTADQPAEQRHLPREGGFLDVVTDRREYMGVHAPGKEALPRLYKINGCAAKWCRARELAKTQEEKEKAARRIILTERQLQSFREERWAEEMFRDRARHCHLLFSGFGSEEPQVRHAALAISAEFTTYAASSNGGGGEAPQGDEPYWDYPAAPWFHVYGPTLSFYQAQVLWGWAEAWGKHTPAASLPRNAFTAEQRSFFGGGREEGLTADRFWVAVLHAWWKRRFLEAWGRTSKIPQALISGLGQADHARLEKAAEEAARRLFHDYGCTSRRAPHLPYLDLELHAGKSTKGEASADDAWKYALTRLAAADRRYHPFRDHPELYALGLLLLAWLLEAPPRNWRFEPGAIVVELATGGRYRCDACEGKGRPPTGSLQREVWLLVDRRRSQGLYRPPPHPPCAASGRCEPSGEARSFPEAPIPIDARELIREALATGHPVRALKRLIYRRRALHRPEEPRNWRAEAHKLSQEVS